MAHKVSPYVNRLGYTEDWNVFFLPKLKQEMNNWLEVNKEIHDYLFKCFPDLINLKIDYCGSDVFIYVYLNSINLISKETEVIPKKIEKILRNKYFFKNTVVKINLIEYENVYSDAQSVANLIANQIGQRLSIRTFLRKILDKISFERDVKGVKIEISGRLDGSEISQTKKSLRGKVSLSTFDESVKFGFKKVITTYGAVGVKVTMCKKKKNSNLDYL